MISSSIPQAPTPSVGVGPTPAAAADRSAVARIVDGAAATPGEPPDFAGCLGLCTPSKANGMDPAPEPSEARDEESEPSLADDPLGSPVSAYPWLWVPPPQFAPPPSPAAALILDEFVGPEPEHEVEVAASVDAPRVGGGSVGTGPGTETPSARVGLAGPVLVAPRVATSVGDFTVTTPVTARPAETAARATTGAVPVEQKVEVRVGRLADANATPNAPVAGSNVASPSVPAAAPAPVAVPASNPDLPGTPIVAPGDVQVPTPALSPARATGEHIAGWVRAPGLVEHESLALENKKIVETNDSKIVKETNYKHGIVSAYGAVPMTSAPAHSPTDNPPAAPVNTAPVTGELASAAVRLVERVTEVAELVRDTPAERVTLNLDLDDSHRVEVRVAVRAGRVHAEFRSDSAEVRTTLSSAWESFTARPDSGSRAWAEPVFAALGATATPSPVDPARAVGAPSGSAANAFGHEATGQGSARREQAGRSRPDADATRAGFFPASKTPVVSQPSSPSRDPHRLLSVQA